MSPYRNHPITRLPDHPILLVLLLCVFMGLQGARAAAESVITGTVVDQLGGRVSAATVRLARDGLRIAETSSDADGEFAFTVTSAGRYQVEVMAAGFERRLGDPIFVGESGHVVTQVRLQIGPLEQQVTVTAAATDVPESQIGAPVTVLDAATLQTLGNTDLLEPLRTIPGVQVVQTGARGGETSLFVRGGNSDFNKILIDGVPANDIGGAFDFADLATTGVDRVEILRGSNSVLYGSDAMTGVVSITTRRGSTHLPEGDVSIDGGNFGTSHEDASLGGAAGRFDYFGDYSHLQTDNSVPNNAYRNNTLAGRFGVKLGETTDLTATVRWIDTAVGSPNAVDFYGIADDSVQTRRSTYSSITARSQITNRWQSTISFGVADQSYRFVNPAPTGQPFDPFGSGPNYLGNTVTIDGANGFSVAGRAILDFGGRYPSVFDSSVTRRLLSGETDYHVTSSLDVAGGVRVENEHGTSSSGSLSSIERHNYGAFAEGRWTAAERLYVTGGVAVDHNQIFGDQATPRVSAAAYLRQPSAKGSIGDTKLTFNAGKGIKEPSLLEELSSLLALIPASTAASLGVSPIGPERSRSLDVGIEQGLAGGHGRVRVAYFNNDFSDLIEFVSQGVLPQLGVPVAAASATPFGAYVNSQSYRAQGIEASGEARLGKVKVTGSYMYLDAVVTKSFADAALSPAINPAFPGIPIGAFSPLVGARPFRRPMNSGSLTASYIGARVQVSVAGYFYGKQDDTTGLTDGFFGNSMLLPNKDLDPAYQKFDISGSYRFHPRCRWYLTLENAFNQRFDPVAGFPALPRSVRTGVTVILGGDLNRRS
jgi:iron complex outermembrane receptor protein/vitamin B12 transporter